MLGFLDEGLVDEVKRIMRCVYLVAAGDAEFSSEEQEALVLAHAEARELLAHRHLIEAVESGSDPADLADQRPLVPVISSSDFLSADMLAFQSERAAVSSVEELTELELATARSITDPFARKIAVVLATKVAVADSDVSDGEIHTLMLMIQEWAISRESLHSILGEWYPTIVRPALYGAESEEDDEWTLDYALIEVSLALYGAESEEDDDESDDFADDIENSEESEDRLEELLRDAEANDPDLRAAVSRLRALGVFEADETDDILARLHLPQNSMISVFMGVFAVAYADGRISNAENDAIKSLMDNEELERIALAQGIEDWAEVSANVARSFRQYRRECQESGINVHRSLLASVALSITEPPRQRFTLDLARAAASVDKLSRKEQAALAYLEAAFSCTAGKVFRGSERNEPSLDDPTEALCAAIAAGDGERVAALLADDAPVNGILHRGGFTATPLSVAINGGHEALVRQLINAGADVNLSVSGMDAFDPTASGDWVVVGGITPLLLAAERGQLDTCRLLLERGALIDARADHGFSPLMAAIKQHHNDVALLLIEHGAELNFEPSRTLKLAGAPSLNPLLTAASNGNAEMAAVLIDRGVNLQVRCDRGFTPIKMAVHAGAIEILELLLEKNVIDVDARDVEGFAALHTAAKAGHVDAARLLLAHGATPDLRIASSDPDHRDRTALMEAAHGHDEIVELLLAAGASPNVRSEAGATPLGSAILSGSLDIAKRLLQAGAAADASDGDGTPLLLLAIVGHHHRSENGAQSDPVALLALVELMLDRGADANSEWNGLRAVEIAEAAGLDALSALLVERGAAPSRAGKDSAANSTQIPDAPPAKGEADTKAALVISAIFGALLMAGITLFQLLR